MIKFLLSNFPISRQADDPPLAFGISVITPPCDPGHDKSVHLLISIERLPGRVVADLRPVFTLMSQELLAAMRQSVIDGATDRAVEAARQALASGVDPLEAIEKGFVPGMDFVGAQFAKHAMFFPDLVMAGEAMKAGVGAIEPELQKQGGHRQFAGKVVLGSARGDIHEIGKCLVGVLLAANGFQVYDLGTSVTPESFLAKAKEVDADIVGISALLTTTMAGQRAVVQAFERDGLRPRVQIIVGGAPVTRGWAQEIGADGYAPDAVATVVLVKSLMKKISTATARPENLVGV